MQTPNPAPGTTPPICEVKNLTMRYGNYLVMQSLNFSIQKGEVFAIMGGSGCGKSTLLRHMIGLQEPAEGAIFYRGENFTQASPQERKSILRQFGVLYQGGALWSGMTLAENITLPLTEYTELSSQEIQEMAALKLSFVGLRGFENYYPAEISGGMRKRAGLARAMALDPDILFFDEPSAGLDPVNSKHLDELILDIRQNLGTTIILVTHELPSIFAIADHAIYLDAPTKTMIAEGNPHVLKEKCHHPAVQHFLRRESSLIQTPD